jgi:hypothetical protein
LKKKGTKRSLKLNYLLLLTSGHARVSKLIFQLQKQNTQGCSRFGPDASILWEEPKVFLILFFTHISSCLSSMYLSMRARTWAFFLPKVGKFGPIAQRNSFNDQVIEVSL